MLEPVGKSAAKPVQQRPVEQVILGQKSTRYNNIQELLSKPAYQSRNAQFIVDMPSGRKEVLKEETESVQKKGGQSESLFD